MKKYLSIGLVALSLLFTASSVSAAENPTTNEATDVTSTGATLNGTTGSSDADNTSFWWGTSAHDPFTPSADPSSQLSDWSYHPTGTGAHPATTTFSYAVTGLADNTEHHFVSWALVGGTWYPGEILSFTTLPTPADPVFIDTNTNGSYDTGEQDFTTIQAAVDAAVAGDTIKVTAGTYTEHVTVNKSLTINGAQSGVDARTRSGSESIVDGSDTDAAFAITANDVTIDGFTVQNGSGGSYYSGIWAQTGTLNLNISNNIISQNGFGIWAQCGGDCMIQNNLFDANNKPGPGSAGISADATTGLTIDNNEFKNHTDVNPILIQGVAPGAHTNLTVSNNEFHDNTGATVIYALAITGGTFNGNSIVSPTDVTGISFSGANANITVTDNTFDGVQRGVRVEDAGYYGVDGMNSNITINDNGFLSNSQYGVGNISGYTGAVDATNNWWGDASGPNDPTGADGSTPDTNAGTGSPAVGAVNYSAWFTNVEMTTTNSSKDITAFSFPEGTGVITDTNIAVSVPSGTNVTALVPTITITGASVNPASGVAQNFTNPVTYTVTAVDGSTKAYIVTVTVSSSNNNNDNNDGGGSGGGSSGSRARSNSSSGGQVLGASTDQDNGCVFGSGHLFSTTTGRPCAYPTDNGCLAGSGHLFSTVTGRPCVYVNNNFKFLFDLRIGMNNADVVQLQARLRAEGFFTYPSNTGYFGPITYASARAYQTAHPEIGYVTGFVGPLTRGVLNR